MNGIGRRNPNPNTLSSGGRRRGRRYVFSTRRWGWAHCPDTDCSARAKSIDSHVKSKGWFKQSVRPQRTWCSVLGALTSSGWLDLVASRYCCNSAHAADPYDNNHITYSNGVPGLDIVRVAPSIARPPACSMADSIARALSRSITRPLARSLARPIARTLDRSFGRSLYRS